MSTSVSALMTGRHPEEIGIFRNESLVPETVPTLASELRELWDEYEARGGLEPRRDLKLERLAEVLGVVDVPGNLVSILEGAIDLITYSADFPYAVNFRKELAGAQPSRDRRSRAC